MSFFKKLFGKPDNDNKALDEKSFDIDRLLASDDLNKTIIELDDHVCMLCDWGENINHLNDQQKNFYYNQNLEREVNNGGFNQYFFNSSGNFAHETIASLNAIGALKTADLLQRAINQFPEGLVPVDRDERQTILGDIEEKANEAWGDIDQAFYQYQDDLNSLNIEYVKKNKEEFKT
jgi:hypothetical protein